MSLNSVLADSLARIKNAGKLRSHYVLLLYSKLLVSVLDILLTEGYISDFEIFEERKGVKRIRVALKYRHGVHVIEILDLISKPSLKKYVKAESVPKVADGMGVAVISTSRGLMPDRAARELGIGGKLLFKVY